MKLDKHEPYCINDKSNKVSPERIIVGLGWEKVHHTEPPKKLKNKFFGLFGSKGPVTDNQKDLHLDLSCVCMNGRSPLEIIHGKITMFGNSIYHIESDTEIETSVKHDSEQIYLDLLEIPRTITSIFFIVNQPQMEEFSSDFRLFCRVINMANTDENGYHPKWKTLPDENENVLCTFELEPSEDKNYSLVLARLDRDGTNWVFSPIGKYGRDGSTPSHSILAISALV